MCACVCCHIKKKSDWWIQNRILLLSEHVCHWWLPQMSVFLWLSMIYIIRSDTSYSCLSLASIHSATLFSSICWSLADLEHSMWKPTPHTFYLQNPRRLVNGPILQGQPMMKSSARTPSFKVMWELCYFPVVSFMAHTWCDHFSIWRDKNNWSLM